MRLSEIVRNPNKLPSSAPSQAHLYHGTQLYLLAAIIKTDTLWQGAYWHKPGEPHGVRCTRRIEAAMSFAFDQEHPGGILVMSWPKIAQRYKTIPYEDTHYNDDDPTQPGEKWGIDEAEEVVLTAAIRPLSTVLESILMQPEELRNLRAGEYLKDEWIGSYVDWAGRRPSTWRIAIKALMDYPNIRTI